MTSTYLDQNEEPISAEEKVKELMALLVEIKEAKQNVVNEVSRIVNKKDAEVVELKAKILSLETELASYKKMEMQGGLA